MDKLIVEPLRKMFESVAVYMPKLIIGLLILLVGLFVARLIRRLVQKVLDAIGFDKMSEKAGIEKALDQGGIKTTAGKILSGLVFWLVVIMVLVMTVDYLGLKVAKDMLTSLIDYIPKVIAGVFVLVFGMFLSVFIHGVVTTAASNAHIPQAKLIGGISKYAIVIFAFVIALKQFNIDIELITTTFKILFGAVCLALAIAFGFGCKDLAAKYAEDLFKKKSS